MSTGFYKDFVSKKKTAQAEISIIPLNQSTEYSKDNIVSYHMYDDEKPYHTWSHTICRKIKNGRNTLGTASATSLCPSYTPIDEVRKKKNVSDTYEHIIARATSATTEKYKCVKN